MMKSCSSHGLHNFFLLLLVLLHIKLNRLVWARHFSVQRCHCHTLETQTCRCNVVCEKIRDDCVHCISVKISINLHNYLKLLGIMFDKMWLCKRNYNETANRNNFFSLICKIHNRNIRKNDFLFPVESMIIENTAHTDSIQLFMIEQ